MKYVCAFLVVNLAVLVSSIFPSTRQAPPTRVLVANLTKLPTVVTDDADIQHPSTINGQIVLRRFVDDRQRLFLSFDAFNLLVASVQSQVNLTGQVSLRSQTPSTAATIMQTSTGDDIRVSLALTGHYGLIDRLGGYERSKFRETDEYPARTENFFADLKGRLVLPRTPGGTDGTLTLDGDIIWRERAVLAAVRRISLHLQVPITDFPPQACPLSRLANTRTLCLQPVFVRASATDTAASQQAFFAAELASANLVWGRCCIRFDALPAVFVDRPSLQVISANADGTTSLEERDLLGQYSADECIEVFVIQSFDPDYSHAGGATWDSGAADAKIIIAANSLPVNQFILAHQLGHVLASCHPGSGCTAPRVDASAGSVMEPRGFFSANPNFQSGANCTNAANALLRTQASTCCVNPDGP